jgi:16S rRNA U1498 N3-methylase RsmE
MDRPAGVRIVLEDRPPEEEPEERPEERPEEEPEERPDEVLFAAGAEGGGAEEEDPMFRRFTRRPEFAPDLME